MENIKKAEVFRLAAVLYADNNYEVSPITIHRKIIESVFMDNNNLEKSIHEIIDIIELDYGFVFDYEEVSEIVNKEKDEYFLIGKNSSAELTVSLTPKRLSLLRSKLNNTNIDHFINIFSGERKEIIGSLNAKAIIYKFLYEIFLNNISSFSKLIDYKKDLEGAIDIDESFNPVEKEIVNAFLQWENDSKNKAIFDIASYALEYCLITNNNSKSSFRLQNLKNKDFYLDTNVIFRAIGINGENRKNRTTTFLNKFNEAGENLIISKFTENEYKSTIKHYTELIIKKKSDQVNPKVFAKFKKDSDFFDYYHKWRLERTNHNANYFESYLIAEYEAFKKKFKINEDYQIPFDENKEDEQKKINELAADIFSFKNQQSSYYGRFETAVTDAKNIMLINTRRNGLYKNIFETKYFLVSSDQGLRRWDFSKSSATPVVLLPSQWLSILLRYLNRSSDDFKSFVSFLNLSQSETKITNEKLQLILIGIGEITQDFEQQSSIVSVMVEAKFKGILEKNYSEDEIIEHSKDFAKSKLEQDLEDVKKQKEILAESFQLHKDGASAAIYDLELQKQGELNKARVIESENRKLKKQLRDKEIKSRLKYWRLVAYFSIIPLAYFVFFYIELFLPAHKYNLSNIIAIWIDSLPEDSTKRQVAHSLYLVPLACIVPLSLLIWNRLFNPVAINENIENIESSLPEDVK